ncbi:MAG: hypothetical protein NTX45_07845 [Proteobacteria bacterium]|nr:hypothetical protein [Pseudomonadota bacterium]
MIKGNQSEASYHIGKRLAGEYFTVKDALVGMGFPEKKAGDLAKEYDSVRQCLYLEIPFCWCLVQCEDGKFFNYDGIKTGCADIKAMEFFCGLMNRLMEESGNPSRLMILADLPKSAVQ